MLIEIKKCCVLKKSNFLAHDVGSTGSEVIPGGWVAVSIGSAVVLETTYGEDKDF